MKIEVKNARFKYPHSERTVLDNISFSLEKGDVLAVLGPNGAGKTTLLRCITGLLKWQGGSTLLGGQNIREIPLKTLWRKLSYVPQAKPTPSAYTVEEMILLGRASMVNAFSVPKKEDMDAVDLCIEKTGLESIRHRYCSQLSGGELQMVLIARALASEPEILILDEPESNLDFQNQLLVLNMISQLSSEGITCIFNTHYPAHALRRATKALMLSKSGEYIFGSTREIVTEENILKYFGVKTVIGDLETDSSTYSDVVPVAIAEKTEKSPPPGDRVIAAMTVIMEGNEHSERLNSVLHDFSGELIGRMGLPYRKAGVNIITLTLDAESKRVHELSDRISLIPCVHVKTAYISGADKDE